MVIGLLLLLQLGTPPVYDRVILGGRVTDPASKLDAVRNIGLVGGRNAVITTDAIHGRDTIDAGGLVVAPASSTFTRTDRRPRHIGSTRWTA